MEVLVAIVVALIAAGAGFAGGYYSAKWKAESDLEQWRREKLLAFCADFLAASGEIINVGQSIQDFKNPPFPTEIVGRFMQAHAGICLLSDQLAASAQKVLTSALKILVEGPVVTDNLAESSPAIARTYATRGLFLRAAHDFLLNLPRRTTIWERMWNRLPDGVRSPLTSAATVIGLIAPRREGTAPPTPPAPPQG
jgi:hypothetical protein